MKIGDRVRNIRIECHKDEPIEIIAISSLFSNRYYIKYYNLLNVSGYPITSWVDGDDLELDKQFYRELKINEILNE